MRSRRVRAASMQKVAPVEELSRAIRAVADDRLFLDQDAARLMVLQRYRKAGQVDDEKVTAQRLSARSEEHTSELQSHSDLVCRLLLEKKKKTKEINRWFKTLRAPTPAKHFCISP